MSIDWKYQVVYSDWAEGWQTITSDMTEPEDIAIIAMNHRHGICGDAKITVNVRNNIKDGITTVTASRTLKTEATKMELKEPSMPMAKIDCHRHL